MAVIAIDATELSLSEFLISGAGSSGFPSFTSDIQQVDLSPGNYRLGTLAGPGFQFQVTAAGELAVDPSLSGFVVVSTVAGVPTLQVRGFQFGIDATALTLPEFMLRDAGGLGREFHAAAVQQVRLIPGPYRFAALTGPTFPFAVTEGGELAVAPSASGFVVVSMVEAIPTLQVGLAVVPRRRDRGPEVAVASFRDDYAFPFRISTSGSAAQSPYAVHAAQMIRQVLLTAPGERVDLPEFGCGLRKLLFAPVRSGGAVSAGLLSAPGDATTASAQILVQQALERWLGNQIQVREVTALGGGEASVEGELKIDVRYVLIETQDTLSTRVRLL